MARTKVPDAMLVNPASGANPTVKSYGAIGDGVTNDRAAFVTADGLGTIRVPFGDYLIGSSLTIGNSIIFDPGAALVVGNGVTITLNGDLAAGGKRLPIFKCTGTGAIVINERLTTVGFPEWFGAQTNNSGFDCLDSLQRCINTFPVTQLVGADYYTSGTLTINQHYKKLIGILGSYGYHAGTRIMCTSATATILFVGYATIPGGGIGAFLQDIRLESFDVVRTVAPTAPLSADTTSGTKGIHCQWTLFTYIDRVQSWESHIGFFINGTCNVKMKDGYAGRSLASPIATYDYFAGYYMNGAGNGMPAAGGNASTYFTDCGAGASITPTTHAWIFNKVGADTFMLRCEGATLHYGVLYVGSQGDAQAQTGDCDIRMQSCVFDGCKIGGFIFSNLAAGAQVSLIDNYAAAYGGANFTGLSFVNCSGQVRVAGTQVIGWPGTSVGCHVAGSTGIDFQGNLYLDCVKPFEAFSSSALRVEDNANNVTVSSTQGGFYFDACNRLSIKPMIYGGTNRLSYGIRCVNNCSAMSIDPTLIHPTPASNNKLYINGSNVTTTTDPSGLGNIISGVLG